MDTNGERMDAGRFGFRDKCCTTVNLVWREEHQMNRNRLSLLSLELAEGSSHYEISVLHHCSSLAECMKLLITFEYSPFNWPASPWKGSRRLQLAVPQPGKQIT
jgi:hypothetical protein